MNVLLVDDSKLIYLMVSQMLKDVGHDCTWAEDGTKAIEILSKDKTLQLILLDWNMTKMSGPEFLEKNIKEKITTAPIIMMTTENSPDYIKTAFTLGAVDYLIKPFTKDILFNKISQLELNK